MALSKSLQIRENMASGQKQFAEEWTARIKKNDKQVWGNAQTRTIPERQQVCKRQQDADYVVESGER